MSEHGNQQNARPKTLNNRLEVQAARISKQTSLHWDFPRYGLQRLNKYKANQITTLWDRIESLPKQNRE